MEWLERLNDAVAELEEHLTGEIDYARLARTACCSTYHFQRMFAYLAGVPLSEYIRRRRMSLAAAELQSGGEKILDLALKYGYASPTAFNRAFQNVHGVAPSAVKKGGVTLKAYPPVCFKITVKGVEEMNYRIEKREPFRVVGLSAPMPKEPEKGFDVVPGLWQKAAAEGIVPRLAAMMDQPPMGILGVCACGDDEQWQYLIAVSTSQPAEAPLVEYTVPACTWAVFPGEGVCPQAIQELEKHIITEWLPTSGYEYGDGPDVEVYLTPEPANAKFEVWIPVIRK